MGLRLAEATNASRMRRTRGEIGRFFLLVLAARDCAVPVFLAGDLLPAVVFDVVVLDLVVALNWAAVDFAVDASPDV
jgi:hypothetical protein